MNEILLTLLTNKLAVSASFGIFGGILRAVVDFSKFSAIKTKGQKIYSRGVMFYALSMVLIGAFMGLILDFNWALSVLGGYAGQDVLDILYKSLDKIKVKRK